MRLPALCLSFLRGLDAGEATGAALREQLLGTVLWLPPDLAEVEREEICDLAALFLGLPVHVSARPEHLPERHACVLTEPVGQELAPVNEGVVIAIREPEAGRRCLGAAHDLRRLRDSVLAAIAPLGDIAGWAQEVADSPSTALRFASAAHRERLSRPAATDAELVAEGLAETIAWLFRGVDPRVAEWVLEVAVSSATPAWVVSAEAALLGEAPALQRALAAGLVEHLPERRDDPDDALDLRRPLALLGRLDDLSVDVGLAVVLAALRRRLDPALRRAFERLTPERPRPLRLFPPAPPPTLVGRDDVIARLCALFEPAREICTVVLCGDGGIGKTAVAAALCERLADRLEPVWLTFAGGPAAAWQRVADALGVETKDAWLERVHRAMAERDALIVVDDVGAVPESELPRWLPAGAGTCSVLVLSRAPRPVLEREHAVETVSLRALGDEEARRHLADTLERLGEPRAPGKAAEVLAQLGGHPGAIRSVADALVERRPIEVARVTRALDAHEGRAGTNMRELLDAYEQALDGGDAALFAGAGLSRPAGFVDWRRLLRGIADELGLDVDAEPDLAAVVQFYVNKWRGRDEVIAHLIGELSRGASVTRNHELIASLPIPTLWTINYDTVIEEASRRARKRLDVKIRQEHLASYLPKRDAVLYKMHGDVGAPDEAVLVKDDYERYDDERRGFSAALRGDLGSKTFVFLGLSFSDPGIDLLLARIRGLLDANRRRDHFCVMKAPDPAQAYAARRLDLRVDDLRRYGIQTVLVDDFGRITEMFEELARRHFRRDIFVSGSADDYSPLGPARIEGLARRLGAEIIRRGYNLTSAYGPGIGRLVTLGAIDETFKDPKAHLDERIDVLPMPPGRPDSLERDVMQTRLRAEMIQRTGFSVFICGNKRRGGSVVRADGCLEEFDITTSLGKHPIPIGVTGWVAQELWQEVTASLARYFPRKEREVAPWFQVLGDVKSTDDQLMDAVFGIIDALVKR